MSGITNAQLAQRINELITFYDVREQELDDWMNGVVGGGPNTDGTYPLTDREGNVVYVASPAQLEDDVSGLVGSAETFKDDAETAETNAALSEAAAEAARDLALSYRDTALTHKTGAEDAETGAENAAVNAVAAKDKAEEWAEEAEDVEVETGQYSALHHAAKAADSAAAALVAAATGITGSATGNLLDWDGAAWQVAPSVVTSQYGIQIKDTNALGVIAAVEFFDNDDVQTGTLYTNTHMYLRNTTHGGDLVLGVYNDAGVLNDILTVDPDAASAIINGRLGVNPPSDYWSSGENYHEIAGVGWMGTNGSYGTDIFSNGYRNDLAGWTSMGVNSNVGASGISLRPNGDIVMYGQDDAPSGTVPTKVYEFDASADAHRWFVAGINEMELQANELQLDGKNAIQFNDTYLRLNQDSEFTSGIYSPGRLRADGGFRTNSTLGYAIDTGGTAGIRSKTGSYGTVQTYGAAGWQGYSIAGRAVWMWHTTSDYGGLYDDINNKWIIRAYGGAELEFYQNGVEVAHTTTLGLRRKSEGQFIHHGSTSHTSGKITVSTSAPSGGSNGDIWLEV